MFDLVKLEKFGIIIGLYNCVMMVIDGMVIVL